jgi:hypothetical protein
MSRFDDLLKAKKLKPGEPELCSSVALPKSKDPNFVRTTLYLSKQLHRQLKSAAAHSDREMSGWWKSPWFNTSNSSIPTTPHKHLDVV